MRAAEAPPARGENEHLVRAFSVRGVRVEAADEALGFRGVVSHGRPENEAILRFPPGIPDSCRGVVVCLVQMPALFVDKEAATGKKSPALALDAAHEGSGTVVARKLEPGPARDVHIRGHVAGLRCWNLILETGKEFADFAGEADFVFNPPCHASSLQGVQLGRMAPQIGHKLGGVFPAKEGRQGVIAEKGYGGHP